jgi:hypothetical protein
VLNNPQAFVLTGGFIGAPTHLRPMLPFALPAANGRHSWQRTPNLRAGCHAVATCGCKWLIVLYLLTGRLRLVAFGQ